MEKRHFLIMVKYCALLAFISFCFVPRLHAKDFAGVWSNEKGEFQTFTVSLRKDGRGILSTAIFSVPLRWENKNDGILVRATFDKRVSEMFLHYDRKKDVFLLKKESEDSANVLKKVSDEEPPDLEAEIMLKEKQEREKNRTKFQMEKTVLNSRPELIADLTKRMRQFDGQEVYYVNVRPEGKEAHFQVIYGNNLLSVSVLTLYKRIEKLSATMSEPEPLPEPPNLPTLFRMSDSVRQSLENKLKEGDYKYSLGTVVGRGMWEVESYRQELQIHTDKDREKIIRIVEFIINETFREWSGPYVVSAPASMAQSK